MTQEEFVWYAVISVVLIGLGVRAYHRQELTLAAVLFTIPTAGWMSLLMKNVGWLQ